MVSYHLSKLTRLMTFYITMPFFVPSIRFGISLDSIYSVRSFGVIFFFFLVSFFQLLWLAYSTLSHRNTTITVSKTNEHYQCNETNQLKIDFEQNASARNHSVRCSVCGWSQWHNYSMDYIMFLISSFRSVIWFVYNWLHFKANSTHYSTELQLNGKFHVASRLNWMIQLESRISIEMKLNESHDVPLFSEANHLSYKKAHEFQQELRKVKWRKWHNNEST